MNPVAKVKSGASGVVSGFRAHPIAWFLFGMVFSAFLFPVVARFLGGLYMKGGVWSKIIPQRFTA
jgi:hypothetical protein